MPRFSIFPTEEGFYDWFDKGASNLVDTARLLCDLLHNYSDVEAKVGRITDCEHRGDFIVHEVFNLLHRTFIPPLDRGAIRDLVGSLDDVVDNIEAAADLMLLYKVERPTESAARLGEIILACAEQIYVATPLLRKGKTVGEVLHNTIEINRLENVADEVSRAGIAHLLEHPGDLYNLMRWKEIYTTLEAAADRCEDVADALNGIVLDKG